MTGRTYPDETVDSFPEPPLSFTDGEDRKIRVEPSGVDDFDALVEMYDDFDPADRAQGIPPVNEDAIREWLDTLLAEGSLNVVAVHGDRVIGHAILDVAEDLPADFIVVPRERGIEPEEALGKSAQYVVEYASQPVLSV